MRSSLFFTEVRASLKLAWPIVAAQISIMGMVFTDNVMVGRLGKEPLASMAMAVAYYTVLFVSAIGFMWALSPLISQAEGGKEREKIAAVWKHGMHLAMFISILLIVLFQLSDRVFFLLGQKPELIPAATAFLKTISWGIPGHLGFVTLRQLTEGTSDTKPAMRVGLIAFGLNAFLDYLLIYGNFGFPRLGVVGSGLATAFVGWFMFLVLSIYVYKSKRYQDIVQFKKTTPIQRNLYKEISKLGLPIAGAWIGEIGYFASAAIFMGWIGATELAAHQIALNAASFSFMFPMGVSMATSIRVGTAVGMNDYEGAKWSGYAGFFLASLVMSCTALIFLLEPEWIVGIYTKDLSVLHMGATFLMIGGIFQLFDGLQVAGVGALRGLKETRVPLINSLIAYWGIGLPLSLFLAFRSPLGAKGIWVGMVVGLFIAALLHILRFQTKLKLLRPH